MALIQPGQLLLVLEVGAGTGGTASSILPVLVGSSERYVFTDVSEVFLRQARIRFTDYAHVVDYSLLNIDAEPQLQGFATDQYDLAIATNVLHATPFIRKTLCNCQKLLKVSGLLVVNEALATSAFTQTSFGLTDGWWLFSESCDPERSGQGSPLFNWRQWEALLIDSGFDRAEYIQGDAPFLRSQAVFFARGSATSNVHTPALRDGGMHFLSGGLGGLGLLTARLLVEGGAEQLVLSSRSDRVVAGSEGDWARLIRSGGNVKRVRCDASDWSAVRTVIRGLAHGNGTPLSGVFHAAHQLADAALINQQAAKFRQTYGPKVIGAVALHAASHCESLGFFNLYSSIAGLLGSPGQASHSAANTWLDAMAAFRRRSCVTSQSVNWGAVAEIGYAARHGADQRAELSGHGAVTREAAVLALSRTLLSACRSFVVLPAAWSKVLGAGEARGFLTPYAHLGGNAQIQHGPGAHLAHAGTISFDQTGLPSDDNFAQLLSLPPAQQHDFVEAMVLRAVRELTGVPASALGGQTELIEAGVDSLAATELASRLRSFTGVALSPSLLFEHPTSQAVASHLLEKLSMSAGVPTSPIPAALKKAVTGMTAGVPASAQLPVSSMQHQLLLHQLLGSGSTAYNEPIVVPMAQPARLTAPIAHAALQSLVRRHTVLRTYYALDTHTGAFHQVVLPADGFIVPLSCFSEASGWKQHLERELRTPFDLLTMPPIRGILRLTEPSLLVINVHHVAADGDAMMIMRNELAAHCAALMFQQSPAVLLPVEYEYADFARWEHARGLDDQALAWWVDHLHGAPETVNLPLDRPRPDVQATAGSEVEFKINAHLTALATSLSASVGATLNSALLTIWAALLLHLSSQNDVVIGIPHSMRCS